MDEQEAVRIAKAWYTEQRGRVLGNTTPWDELPNHVRWNIVASVEDSIETMKEAWEKKYGRHSD